MNGLTTREAATATGLGMRTVNRLITNGVIHAERSTEGHHNVTGYSWLIPHAELPKLHAYRARRALTAAAVAGAGRRIAPTEETLDWMAYGACRDEDPSLWHPEGGSKHATAAIQEQAVRICNRCQVKSQCGEHAITNREEWGVWGGLTQRERRAIFAGKNTREVAA